MAVIEYFYAAHSAFAWIGSRRFMEIAAAAGRTIVHRPVDLRRVVAEAGAQPFGKRSKAHGAYFFHREIDRWCEWRDVAWLGRIPTHHANDITLPNCLLIAAMRAGLNIDVLAHSLLGAHWVNDADLADAATLARLARGAGLDPEPLLEAARAPETLADYARYTQEAIDRSVFGSPTYVVDGDPFYGQDRLEMVERALQQPFRR
ncbi:MAG: DsbA family protein [Pseudomonadota bacterium]|nr:DsbA family protein [Pseudomonadota bacterium]